MIGEPNAINHPVIIPRLSCHEWLTAQSARLQKKQRPIPASVPHHMSSARSGQGIRSSNPIMTFSVYSKPPETPVCQFSLPWNLPFDGHIVALFLWRNCDDNRLGCRTRSSRQRHCRVDTDRTRRDRKADRLSPFRNDNCRWRRSTCI